MNVLFAVLQQRGAGRWTAEDIHDTVAAIVRQPEYATPLRQSLVGRVFRFIAERIGDVIALLRHSPSSRVVVITSIALVLVVVAARIAVARRVDAARRLTAERSEGRRGQRLDPWADAHARAAAGDYEGATHLLYAGVIDSLARAGLVKHHRSKTGGDYARELARRGAPNSRDFRSFIREADRVIFGTHRPDANDYDQLRQAAARIAGISNAA
jgi:hypothetical protein